ncbi:MAG: uvrC 1 [Myxococcaceae bacterium]|nr:uvrC 1 [Myxococcaceae bacterium]
MADLLCELSVLVLDCQASGATPLHGDLLELGWAMSSATQLLAPVRSHWVEPRTARPVPRAVRELTGWSSACLRDALSESDAWAALREDMRRATGGSSALPTAIHYARFELPFLRDLSERLEPAAPFPFDTVDLHTIGTRLYPDLPRRSIRALAGFLGHAPELMRRAAGHVEASAFIWRAVVPVLAQQGVVSWSDLQQWLVERPATVRRTGRVYPLLPERRRSLPDRPGVYRFVRLHGDILYVGKAASLKKRVASHFARAGRPTERNLEMLTQVHDIDATETASVLEAALLETDEIKRIDPPYNVQLRAGERSAWFAARDLTHACAAPDLTYRVGPLPSEHALVPLAALIALAAGVPAAPLLQAQALAVSMRELPEAGLFEQGFADFAAEHLTASGPAAQQVDRAARKLWLERGRREVEVASEDVLAPVWDLARVRRRLERNLIQSGLLQRRARFLCLLADADVAYRELDMERARALCIAGCDIASRHDLASVDELARLPARWPGSLQQRQRSFDAAGYDRLRVLATELRRVRDDGGEVALRIGLHLSLGEQLDRLLRALY